MMVVVVVVATTRTAKIVGVAVGVVVVRCPFFLSHFKDIIKITLTNKSTLLSWNDRFFSKEQRLEARGRKP